MNDEKQIAEEAIATANEVAKDIPPLDPNNLPPGVMILKTTAFPHRDGIFVMRNQRYWQSFTIGLTYPLLELPFYLWHMLLLPMIRGGFSVLSYFAYMTLQGVSGNLVGVKVPKGKQIMPIE